MQQQLARPIGIVRADTVGEQIRGNVDPIEPYPAVQHARACVGHLQMAESQALDLAALQDDACLERVEDLVVVPCLVVARNELAIILARAEGDMGRGRVATQSPAEVVCSPLSGGVEVFVLEALSYRFEVCGGLCGCGRGRRRG